MQLVPGWGRRGQDGGSQEGGRREAGGGRTGALHLSWCLVVSHWLSRCLAVCEPWTSSRLKRFDFTVCCSRGNGGSRYPLLLSSVSPLKIHKLLQHTVSCILSFFQVLHTIRDTPPNPTGKLIKIPFLDGKFSQIPMKLLAVVHILLCCCKSTLCTVLALVVKSNNQLSIL